MDKVQGKVSPVIVKSFLLAVMFFLPMSVTYGQLAPCFSPPSGQPQAGAIPGATLTPEQVAQRGLKAATKELVTLHGQFRHDVFA